MGRQYKLGTAIALTVLLSLIHDAQPYRILIAPMVCGLTSRLMNMVKMADMLAQDGHYVDVILNNRVPDRLHPKHANIINFNVPDSIIDVTEMPIDAFQFEGLAYFESMEGFHLMQLKFCEILFADDRATKKLRAKQYDLMIADYSLTCVAVLGSNLNVTTILYQNFGYYPDSTIYFPTFPSFVCQTIGIHCQSEEMSFYERVVNTLFLAANNYYVNPHHITLQKELAKNSGIELKTPLETFNEDKIMLVNADWVFHTPRPTMPHLFAISGLFYKQPSPLPAEFQNIIDQSGPHGVILVSFGTLVPMFSPKTAEKFAKVFGKLKQQVIWRYIGEKPIGLQKNTHLIEWLPQNDLLANPAIKLFITHCGISSTFESIFHTVPLIAMPRFLDQTYNAVKVANRIKTGLKLDYHTFTENELQEAIEEVLNNPTYKENAKRTLDVMSDRLVPPVQQLRHLVNFTIKTEGAKHLFHPYAVRMSWFTYFSVDVVLFLLSICIVFTLAILFILRTLFRCCCKRKESVKIKKQ